jgi:phenylacetate-CoA ligase
MFLRIMRNRRFNPTDLKNFQNKKLRAIVKHSYDHVQYYHSLFKEAKIKPDDIKTIDDLDKIPITKREDILNLPLEKTLATNIDLSKCILLRTSGTTGPSLPFYCEKKARLMFYLQHYRWQLECGDKMTNRQLVIAVDWIPLHPLQKIGIFNTKRISNFEDAETRIKEIKKFNPNTLITLPSWVRVLAKEIEKKNEKQIKLSLIFTSGETLDEYTRELARESFDAEIFDGYGANEVGGISTECVKHEGNHIWSDSVLVEITRDGETVATGEQGEITATNLINYAMPFLRYKVGDLGVLIGNECSCGSHFPLMRITEGRKSDIIQLPDGRLISALPVYGCCARAGINQFQMMQEKTDRFTVKIVKDSKFTDMTIEEVKRDLKQRLGDVEVDVLVVDKISREKSGKVKPFLTKVPINDSRA